VSFPQQKVNKKSEYYKDYTHILEGIWGSTTLLSQGHGEFPVAKVKDAIIS
jgi:hypothetical protein